MAVYQGSTVVKRRPKDGANGLPGPLLVQKEWVQGDTHRYTDEIKDYIYVRGDSNDTSYWYTLANKGTVTADEAPTEGTTPNGYVSVNWMKELAVKFLIAEEANLANFIFQNGRLSSEDGLSGLNGVAGSANNNPVLWAGGTYNDALSGTAKAIIRHDGSVKFTEAEITGTISSNASGNRIIIDSNDRALYMKTGDVNIIEMSFNEGVSYPHIWLQSEATGQYVAHLTNAFLSLTNSKNVGDTTLEGRIGVGNLDILNSDKNLEFQANVISNTYLYILMKGLPTSSTGLSSGQLWRNGSVINIVI